MENLLGNTAGLDCAYFLSFAIGLVWAIFIVITGGLGADMDLPDVDVPDFDIGDVDAFDVGSVGVSPLSPITISTFITAFGAVGIIARHLFAMEGPISLVWSTAGGVLLAGVMFLFYSRFLIGSQGSSEVRISQLAGLNAEVIASIPESGVGEIAVIAQGARVTFPARATSGHAIKRGNLVIIDRMLGTQAFVSTPEQSSQHSLPD
jgi:hypothetical protein